MERLVISREHLDAVIAHSRSDLPNEACGFLFGRQGRVEQVRPILNTDPSPVSYSFDSSEQFRVMGEMESQGLELLGIYHSHPESPPIPSLTDIRRAFFPGTRDPNYPSAAYVIVGLSEDEPEVNAFLFLGDEARKVHLHVVDM
ncbi:MAG: M67 family metallopeptidase [Thermodesulfovibrionales bacterium]|nr:M67 family metallopeptidase [Thermodesulfovibrionales bacterium]